jgi:H+/Cl- antiporter ClcA
VTPLFFLGAALGCTLGTLLGLPHDFMAALGFVAVFAGAANTPLACMVMGIELFGAPLAPYLAIACCGAYLWSGHRGIYLSQIIDTPKADDPDVLVDGPLRDHRQRQPSLSARFDFLDGWRRRKAKKAESRDPLSD